MANNRILDVFKLEVLGSSADMNHNTLRCIYIQLTYPEWVKHTLTIDSTPIYKLINQSTHLTKQ